MAMTGRLLLGIDDRAGQIPGARLIDGHRYDGADETLGPKTSGHGSVNGLVLGALAGEYKLVALGHPLDKHRDDGVQLALIRLPSLALNEVDQAVEALLDHLAGRVVLRQTLLLFTYDSAPAPYPVNILHPSAADWFNRDINSQ